MMTLLREALSWNYVLVTAVISSLLAQFTKVILNLIILGKFIPERLWGAGGMPSAHSATVCALLVATGRYCGTGSTEFALALVLAIIVMYDAMGVRRETGEQAKILNRMLSEWMDRESDAMPFLGDKKLKEMVGHTPIQVLTGAIFGMLLAFDANGVKTEQTRYVIMKYPYLDKIQKNGDVKNCRSRNFRFCVRISAIFD